MLKFFDSDLLKEIRDSAVHYYALAVTDSYYKLYFFRDRMGFRPQFGLFSRAKAVVVYDQIINNECRVRDNLTPKT